MDTKAFIGKVPAIPVVVKKGNPLTLLKNSLPNSTLLKRCIKLVNRDQVIYKSVPGDFLRGEFPGLTLLSRLNIHKQTSTTVAKFSFNGKEIERNSNEIIRVIGQNNYDTVFSALCSVISQELRIRALLALLTGQSKSTEDSTQTEKSYSNVSCQTDETLKSYLVNYKRRVKRQQCRPYVVAANEGRKIKRVVIDLGAPLMPKTVQTAPKTLQTAPETVQIAPKSSNSAVKPKTESEIRDQESLPELSGLINEDSYFSDDSTGNISLTSQHSLNIPQLLHNPKVLYEDIENHTATLNTVPLTLLDGSVLMVCAKPMDKFHWGTADILNRLSFADQAKLMSHQAIIHWKYCMERDEDGYLPIHQAVLMNDLDFLKSQCHALKYKNGSVDVTANGNVTPLHMSVYPGGERCLELLLSFGADPRAPDEQGRGCVHTAAYAPAHLRLILKHCRERAREMLMESEDLWRPEMKAYTDEQLVKILLDDICITCDNQGYTPLMLASKQGQHEAVGLLLQASPDTVNRPMPSCGSTALYLAVSAACAEAYNSMNQSKVSDNFLKTIELLMEAGGDPSLENHSNSSVNTILTEYNIIDLSVLIANKLTSIKYFDGNKFAASNINSLMLYKNSEGKVGVTDIKSRMPNTDFNGISNGNSKKGKAKKPKVSENKGKNTKSKAANSKVGKDTKKKANNSKCAVSKIQIMEIKTIKMEQHITEATADGNPSAPLANVNPSEVILTPKLDKSKPDALKYVNILPKLEGSYKNVHALIKTDYSKLGKVEVKVARPRKRTKTTESTDVTVQKQVKKTQETTNAKTVKKKYIVKMSMSPEKQNGGKNDESNDESIKME